MDEDGERTAGPTGPGGEGSGIRGGAREGERGPDTRRIGRRRYLALAGATVAGSVAGCLDGAGSQDLTTAGGNGSAGQEPGVVGPSTDDLDLPVASDQLNRGARRNAIPAITRPAFGSDWSSAEFSLGDGDRVIGVERDGEARAYPLKVLNWHEIVNDDLGGPLLVTYCPLCASGITAVRRVNGEATTFGVSGLLFRSNLVMYDLATESLWSQVEATAIRGPQTGTQLELVASAITTWDAWRDDHPDTRVLLPPPESETIVDARPRPYGRNPYAGYENNDRIGVGYNDFEDGRLHPKTQVIGVTTGAEARAYPFGAVQEAGVVNDTVGDLPVVVAAGPEETMHAYVRRADGETLSFEPAGPDRMRAGGSEWAVTTGRAVSGPFEGRRLDQASGGTTMFWFTWLDFNPGTTVYGREE